MLANASSIHRNLGVAAVAGALGIGVLWLVPTQVPGATLAAVSDMRSPAFFAIVNGGFLVCCALVLMLRTVLGGGAEGEPVAPPRAFRRLIAVLVLLVLYVAGIRTLGMVVASVAVMPAMGIALGYRRLSVLIPVALIFPLVIYVLFEKALLILLPHGVLF